MDAMQSALHIILALRHFWMPVTVWELLMMDEYVDVWYIHKTKYDYAGQLADWWKQDLKDMVDKDYNHPSVIMYSTGNEVAETAQKKENCPHR